MRLCLTIILLFSPFAVLPQEVITPVAIRDESIENFDAFPIGDSVLVTYRTGVKDEHPGTFQCMLIQPDKSVVDTKMPSTAFTNVISITDSDTALNMYYITTTMDKTVQLKKNWYDKRTGKAKSFIGSLNLNGGTILGAFHTPDLVVLSKDKREDTLIVSHIRDLQLVRERRFFMPRDFLKEVSKTSVISERSRVTPDQGVATLKFYLKSDTLTVVRDSPKPYKGFNGFTEIITVDLKTGGRETTLIGEETQKPFWTYYLDGYLYKIRKSKPAMLMVYKGEKLVWSLTLDKGLWFMSEKSFKRAMLDLSVFKKESVSDVFSVIGFLFVTAHADQAGKIFLKVGSHDLAQSYMYPAGGGLLGVALSAALTSAMTSSMTSYGKPAEFIDRYFYLHGDPVNGFVYSPGQGCVDATIDEYERNDAEPKPLRFKFKNYLKTKSYTYAFYRRRRADEMEIVRFKN